MAPSSLAFLTLASIWTANNACSSTAWGPDGCVFASHMVLASNDPWLGGVTPARIWGNAGPGESVLLTGLPAGTEVLPSNPFSADSAGNWSITVSVPASLTNYSLTFTGKTSNITLQDVLFGHTILASGQSNCDMNVGCTFTTNETAVQALLYPEIRLMNQGATGQWVSAANPFRNMSAVQGFSAVGYYTAFHLKQNIPAFANVPIGLVRSSVGGQVIERFMTPAAMEAVGVPAINATNTSCEGQSSHTLYDTLIEPLIPFVFKTMIWYQGESNCACNFVTEPAWESGYYARLLPQLVSTWRTAFNTSFTTLVVQLASYGNTDPSPLLRDTDPLPALRDTQLSVLQLEGTGLAYPIDLGDDGKTIWTPPTCPFHGGIHPRNKTEVGRRLAARFAQLEGILPAGLLADGPIHSGFAQTTGAVTITYQADTSSGMSLVPTADCVTSGRVVPPQTAACCQSGNGLFGYPFELLLSDKSTYVLAEATVDASTVTLKPLNASLTGPFAGVRYSWQGYPLCVLSNEQGMPAAPFKAALA